MERVPEALDPLVFAFAGLGGLLATRGTSRAARRCAGPSRTALWAPLRPTGARDIQFAATPACAALLAAAFGLTAADADTAGGCALVRACGRGRLATARWFADHFAPADARGPEPKRRRIVERGGGPSAASVALRAACDSGHIATARWLVVRYGDVFWSEIAIDVTFRGSCLQGRLGAARWLANRFAVSIRGSSNDWQGSGLDAYIAACKNAHKAMAWWAIEYFPFERLQSQRGVLVACQYGQLSIARRFSAVHCNFISNYTAYHMLVEVCSKGHLTAGRWLARSTWPNNDSNLLALACMHGRLTTARWLVARFALTRAHVLAARGAAFRYACSRSLAVAQWFVARFAPAKSHVLADCGAVFHLAYERSLAMAQWLVDRFDIVASDAAQVRADEVLWDACIAGKLRAAQWIATHFALTRASILLASKGFYLPSEVCGAGDLPMLRWFTARFALSRDNICFFSARAHMRPIHSACLHGRLATARWITARFALDRVDPRGARGAALRAACSDGHLAMAQWLTARFALTRADVRRANDPAYRGNDRVFIRACALGHLELPKWFAARFRPTRRAARAALRRLSGEKPLARWLIEHFAL